MDLLLKENAAMYLFGNSESEDVPIQIKAIYNFEIRGEFCFNFMCEKVTL